MILNKPGRPDVFFDYVHRGENRFVLVRPLAGYGETANVPPDVAVTNRNFMNLLEAPILFYVFCLTAYATRHVTEFTLYAAWTYVLLRLAHTLVHLFYNRILYRFAPYALSNLLLAGCWLWLAAALFS